MTKTPMTIVNEEQLFDIIRCAEKETIFVILGMSASGKDRLMRRIMGQTGCRKMLSFTTRDKRPNETQGVEYNFVDDRIFHSLRLNLVRTYIDNQGRVIKYGKAIPKSDDFKYVTILDVDGYNELESSTGRKVVSIRVAVPEPIRKCRAAQRDGFDEAAWLLREKIDQDIANFEADYVINYYNDEELKALFNDTCAQGE